MEYLKIVCFIPLLFWTIGWAALCEWKEHLQIKDRRGESNKEEIKAETEIWIYGCIFWFIIAVLSLI